MAIIKQYVNLPTGVTNIHGNRRNLRAHPSSIPNVRASDTVEWWIEPGAGNTNVQYITPASRARLQFPSTLIAGSGANRSFRNRISFPHVGGDEYVVKCSKLNQRPQFLATDTFQTWRKLFYTVFYMGAQAQAQFLALEGQYKTAFSRSFIELERVAQIATMTVMNEARVEYSNDFPFVDGSTNAIINLKRNGKATGTGTLSNKPFHLAFLVVPRCFFTVAVARSMPASRVVTGTTSYFHGLFTRPGDPLAFVTSATASFGASGSINVRNRFSIVSNTAAASRIQWDLSTVPGLTNWVANPARTFNLQFTVLRKSSIGGYSWGNLMVCGMTGNPPAQVLQILTHETGHGAHQVVQSESRWNAAGNPISADLNTNWYNDVFGGHGPHCKTNAVLAPAPTSGLTSGQQYVHGGAGSLCTMYHAVNPNADGSAFCPSCEPRLRRANLGSANQTAQNWHFFG